MSTTNPATLELLMQQRIADRLHEAEQDRIASAARRSSTTRHSAFATVVAFARMVIASL